MLVTMKEILVKASAENYAVAAPNVDSEFNVRAYIEAAEEAHAPIILNALYIANPDIYCFGRIMRYLAQQASVPVAINLDHGSSLKEVLAAINAGFTSVMLDRSSYPDDDNIAQVKQVVDLAHLLDISVEAELGHVGVATQYQYDRDAALTSPQAAQQYALATGVDCLAVAIGTAHGAYPRGFIPYLDFDRLAEIKKAVNGLPLVLHGSSGTDDESLRKVCAMGINKVNVSNDLCKAAVASVKQGDLDGNNAYNVYNTMKKALKEKLIHLIGLYGSTGKAWQPENKGLPRLDTTIRVG